MNTMARLRRDGWGLLLPDVVADHNASAVADVALQAIAKAITRAGSRKKFSLPFHTRGAV